MNDDTAILDEVETTIERFGRVRAEIGRAIFGQERVIELTLAAAERKSGDVVPVYLRSSITEVGTLLLEAIPFQSARENERWKIEFGVRED